MTLVHELELLERAGWEALSQGNGGEFYDSMMAADGVMVLPVGVMDREQAIHGMADAPPWDRYALTHLRAVPIGADGAALAYFASAVRSGETYEAWMVSTYMRSGTDWLLALHQQSPTGG